MPAVDVQLTDLEFRPLTSDRWSDFEKLFGPRGACGGCWCMWWRLSRSQFMKQRGEENKKAIKGIVDSGNVPGIIAYLKEQPIGWCAVAPRKEYVSLERSRLLKRVDDKSVWSTACFFVARPFRHKGLTVRLLEAAVDYVKSNGGAILEGYPVESKSGKMPDPFAYTGMSSAFLKAGFCEVVRRSESRPIMRYVIRKSGESKS